MHFFFLTRGIKQQRDLFVMFMQSQMWKWKRKNMKTGKEEICQVQGALRPIELWEYVLPEECMPELFTILDVDDKRGEFWKLGKFKASILRKALGLGVEKIPKYEKVVTNKVVEHRGVAIYPIGIKKDKRAEWELNGYEQEML